MISVMIQYNQPNNSIDSQMVAFMALNIICFIVDGIAAILLLLAIGLWQTIVRELTKSCISYNYFGKKRCVCTVDGRSRTFEGNYCSFANYLTEAKENAWRDEQSQFADRQTFFYDTPHEHYVTFTMIGQCVFSAH